MLDIEIDRFFLVDQVLLDWAYYVLVEENLLWILDGYVRHDQLPRIVILFNLVSCEGFRRGLGAGI